MVRIYPKVLLTIPDRIGVSGQYEYLRHILMEAERSDVDVDIHALDSLKIPRVARFFAAGGWINTAIMMILYIRRLVNSLPGFDVVHLFHVTGTSFVLEVLPVILLARFFGKRVILEYPDPIPLSRLGARSLFVPKVWRLCHEVVVPSRYQQQVVNMFGGRGRYVQPYSDTGRIKARVVANVQPKIVVVAPLEKESNIPAVIRACRLVKQKYPRTELVVIGDGVLRAPLEHLAEAELIGSVEFVGDLDQPERHRLFESCDIYVNCSSIDHLSAAIAEAFAFGLPVLSTPIAGANAGLRDRENIIHLRFGDHISLADRIIELVEDSALTEKLSRNGVETARRICENHPTGERLQLYSR